MALWNKDQYPLNNLRNEVAVKGSLTDPEDGDMKIAESPDCGMIFLLYSEVAGDWIATAISTGPACLGIGPQITMSDSGNMLSHSIHYLPGEWRTSPYYTFGEDGTVRDLVAPRVQGTPNISYSTNDGTVDHQGVLTGGKYRLETTDVFYLEFLIWQRGIKLGLTTPTAPLKITSYADSESTSNRITSITLPTSFWDGMSPGDAKNFYYASDYEGVKTPLTGGAGQNFFSVLESDEPWSLYGDSTQPFGRVVGQLATRDRVAVVNFKAVSGSQITHESMSSYSVGTASSAYNIVVPDGIGSPFTIHDRDGTFHQSGKNCTVEFDDDVGTPVNTVTLDSIHKTYKFFHNGFRWVYTLEGEGVIVDIDADRTSSEDFPGAISVGGSSEAANATTVGLLRYTTTANSSSLECCMQTGASTYSWVVVKTNTW